MTLIVKTISEVNLSKPANALAEAGFLIGLQADTQSRHHIEAQEAAILCDVSFNREFTLDQALALVLLRKLRLENFPDPENPRDREDRVLFAQFQSYTRDAT